MVEWVRRWPFTTPVMSRKCCRMPAQSGNCSGRVVERVRNRWLCITRAGVSPTGFRRRVEHGGLEEQ